MGDTVTVPIPAASEFTTNVLRFAIEDISRVSETRILAVALKKDARDDEQYQEALLALRFDTTTLSSQWVLLSVWRTLKPTAIKARRKWQLFDPLHKRYLSTAPTQEDLRLFLPDTNFGNNEFRPDMLMIGFTIIDKSLVSAETINACTPTESEKTKRLQDYYDSFMEEF